MSWLGLGLLVFGELVVWSSIVVGRAVAVDGAGVGTPLSTQPFQFDSVSSLAAATSLAIFSFLGFDAITTLAEETRRPKRDIPRAIYWCVGIGTLTMFARVTWPCWPSRLAPAHRRRGLAQHHVVPGVARHWRRSLQRVLHGRLPDRAGRVQRGRHRRRRRLLFGMGRDELLPRAVFARVNRRWRTPHWSILLICAIEFALGNFANMETLSNLVNYGAMFAFAALNISVVWLYYVRAAANWPTAAASGSRRAAPALPAAARRRAGHHPLRGRTWTRWPVILGTVSAGRRHRLPAGQDARLPAAASGARPVTPALLSRCFPLLWRPGMSADSMLALNTYDPPRRPSPTRPSEA